MPRGGGAAARADRLANRITRLQGRTQVPNVPAGVSGTVENPGFATPPGMTVENPGVSTPEGSPRVAALRRIAQLQRAQQAASQQAAARQAALQAAAQARVQAGGRPGRSLGLGLGLGAQKREQFRAAAQSGTLANFVSTLNAHRQALAQRLVAGQGTARHLANAQAFIATNRAAQVPVPTMETPGFTPPTYTPGVPAGMPGGRPDLQRYPTTGGYAPTTPTVADESNFLPPNTGY
jgi:hypothetical protein